MARSTMKIYTKTGDRGETSLMGGNRVPKDSLRIAAYGTVDELNAHLGLIRSGRPGELLDALLGMLQDRLFVLGADLASPRQKEGSVPRIGAADIAKLEKAIDELDAKLEPLASFILPGGTVPASQIHIARTVCRRAERAVVKLAREERIGEEPVVFLNRLSDLLFVMARSANHLAGVHETRWSGSGPGKEEGQKG